MDQKLVEISQLKFDIVKKILSSNKDSFNNF